MIANDVLKCEFEAVKISPRPIRDMSGRYSRGIRDIFARYLRGANGRSEACLDAKRRRKKPSLLHPEISPSKISSSGDLQPSF